MPPFYRRDATQKVRGLLRLLYALRPESPNGKRFDADAFASQNGVSVRTVRRDLNLLRDEEWVEYNPLARAWQRTPQADALTITPLQLTLEEGVALGMARALIAPPMSQNSSVDTDDIVLETLRRTFDRLLAALPQNVQRRASEMEGALRTVPGAVSTLSVPLPVLTEAVSRRQTLSLCYESFSGAATAPAWRQIDPYEIQEDTEKRRLLLHGWCHRNGEIRTFALERASDARVTENRFERRESEWEAFATAKGIVGGLRGSAPVPVDVWFAPEVARYALRQSWPDGLTITGEADSAARLTGLALGTSGLVREVLRWRRFAKVIGGPELRAALREEMDAIQALYPEY